MNYRTRVCGAPPVIQNVSYEDRTHNTLGLASNSLSISRSSEFGNGMPASRLRLLDRIVSRVAETHGISVSEIHSRSRQHELVVARAQIVWLAIEANLSTLSDIARYLHHSPSALTRAVAKYRRRYPSLFTPEAIGTAGPALRDSLVTRRR
jgi:hypothetical protein